MCKVIGQDIAEIAESIMVKTRSLKARAGQCLEIAQNAAVRLMSMEALVDEAIGKQEALACTVDLPHGEDELFDAVTVGLGRMKAILDGKDGDT